MHDRYKILPSPFFGACRADVFLVAAPKVSMLLLQVASRAEIYTSCVAVEQPFYVQQKKRVVEVEVEERNSPT